MDTQYLDGAEGLTITIFLSHIIYHFLSSQIITNGKTHLQTLQWSPYVEILNVIGGIRAYYWSKLDLNDKLRIISSRIIHYQVVHFLLIILLVQFPGNVYFPTVSNMFIIQCFSKLRKDPYDLITIYSQIFQNYNVIFLISGLLRSKNGLMYQFTIILGLILIRILYVIQVLQTGQFSQYPQQFLGQGYQQTLPAFLVFLAGSLYEKFPLIKQFSNKIKCNRYVTIFIIITIYVMYSTLNLFNKFTQIHVPKQQWLNYTAGYVLLRPFYIIIVVILIYLIDLSQYLKIVLSIPILSKLLYVPRMFQIILTCIIWKLLLVNLSSSQIGPSEPVITLLILLGFMMIVQIFATLSCFLINPIVLVIFKYFDNICDNISQKFQVVTYNFKLK